MLPDETSPAVEQQREHRLFLALDTDGDGIVPKADIIQALNDAGLLRADERLGELFAQLDASDDSLDLGAFAEIIGPAGLLVERALQGGLALPDFADFSRRARAIFREATRNVGGAQADYIPPLAEVNPDQFGLAVVSIDGQVLALGDADTDFSIQSTCKPFNYCFALDELGQEKVHQHVGMEPSGRAFNERVLLQDGTHRPHNPMINAGAIMCASLIRNDLPVHKRLHHVRDIWARLTGGKRPRYNAWMAKEETRTGDNNRALGYMMKSVGVLPKGENAVDHDLRDALELYFSTCSLEMTAREMATAAATLANGGVCPTTQERVLSNRTVRNCLSLMQMCGMYDGSGEFCFKIGLPAKSGVGGAVLLVVPRLMGVCIWSPRLDAVGNSVRGVQVATALTDVYSLHIYDGVGGAGDRIDPRVPLARWRASLTSQALWAASKGDVRTLRRLYEEHADLEKGDYDLRSPMHLAAAEGHTEALEFLLGCGISPDVTDRWGGRPLDDAELAGHDAAAKALRKAGASNGESKHISTEGSTDPATQFGDADAVVELLWAAAENDLEGLRRLVAQGVPMSAADYDGRTALHLAASEGQVEAVRYLLAHGHPLNVRDRWNATPLDEAVREDRDAVARLLESAAS